MFCKVQTRPEDHITSITWACIAFTVFSMKSCQWHDAQERISHWPVPYYQKGVGGRCPRPTIFARTKFAQKHCVIAYYVKPDYRPFWLSNPIYESGTIQIQPDSILSKLIVFHVKILTYVVTKIYSECLFFPLGRTKTIYKTFQTGPKQLPRPTPIWLTKSENSATNDVCFQLRYQKCLDAHARSAVQLKRQTSESARESKVYTFLDRWQKS